MSGRPARATTERSGADGRFGRLRLCLADSFPKTSRIFNVTGVPGAAAACSLVKFSANTAIAAVCRRSAVFSLCSLKLLRKIHLSWEVFWGFFTKNNRHFGILQMNVECLQRPVGLQLWELCRSAEPPPRSPHQLLSFTPASY